MPRTNYAATFPPSNDGSHEKEWFMRFNVLHFGGRASPAIAGIFQQRILEWARGPPDHPVSPFQYERVLLNLETSAHWDPSLPRVMRIRKDGELASAEVDYVDDIHPTARGRDNGPAVRASKWLKSRMNSVGNQADDRKYRQPTCRPGAWKGEIMHTDQPLPRKSTTSKKWVRFKSGIDWVLQQANTSDVVSTAELRRIAGLGINVTEVYQDARCYLKGFFNAIEAFRANRDLNGWRIRADVEEAFANDAGIVDESGLTTLQIEDSMTTAEQLELEELSTASAQAGYPLLTKITPELIDHCEALMELFDSEQPREVFIRPASSSGYRYYVGDASREGLGGATQFPDGSIRGRRGMWQAEFASGGSNLREATNHVNHLIREIREGLHDGCALLCAFTDNGVWSAVWLKGLSTARHLFNLVLQLRIECRIHEVYLSVCHISGSRMIETGIDGWSRGDFETGISLGYDLRNFLPLDKTAFDMAGASLIPWLKSWMGKDYSKPLDPEGWFWDGHLPGIHLWTPPPAAALIALKQLSRTKQKRRFDVTHIVLIPRLLYWEEWQSRFEKEMDIWFVMHHGPILGYSDWNPKKWWKLDAPCQSCQKRVTFDSGILCANYGVTRGRFDKCIGAWCAKCFKSHELDCFEVKLPRDFNGASLAEVEDLAQFRVARPGDHIVTSFQCPNCQSQNIRGHDLDRAQARDQAFEALAVRATLDAFWSHATSTVSAHVASVRFMSRYGDALGFSPMPALGPFPLGQHGGMLEAILLLMRSTEKGRKKDTVQFATARKVRATLTRIWEASPESKADVVLSSASVKGRYIATHAPSESRWYEHFGLGVSARMGDVVSQDRAYTLAVVHKLLESYQSEWNEKQYEMSFHSLSACMFLLVSCLGGMRGFEVMWTDLAALRYDLNYCEEADDYTAVAWPIVGRFKAHDGRLGCYMIPIAGETKSGITFYKWTERFVGRLAMEGHCDGWAFKRKDGTRAKASDYIEDIYKRLEHIQETTSLIDKDCDVRVEYGAQRSGRRFFTTNATIEGVSPHVIELQCRWQTDRANGDRSVTRSMIHLYSEVRNMKKTLIQPSLVC